MQSTHWICAAIFGALLISASFFDLPLSIALFNPHSQPALLMEKFGHLPGNTLSLFCGAGLLCAALTRRRALKPAGFATLALGGALFAAAGFYIITHILTHDAGLAPGVSFGIAALTALAAFEAMLPATRAAPSSALKLCLTGIVCAAVPVLTIGALKLCWGRQRFFAMDNPLTDFTAWFAPQGKARSDQFKSFPSGHAYAAAALIWLTSLPAYFKSLAALKRPLAAFCALYLAAMMLSRIVLGRHFLSDVTVAAGLTVFCFFASRALVDKHEAALNRLFFRQP